MAYDEKLRLAVIKFKDSGHTFAGMREIFGVNPQCYYKRKKELGENGSIKNKYPKTHKGKIDPVKLLKLLEEHPDWYLERFAGVFGVCHQAVQKRFAKRCVHALLRSGAEQWRIHTPFRAVLMARNLVLPVKKNVHLFWKIGGKTGRVFETGCPNTRGKPRICRRMRYKRASQAGIWACFARRES